MGIGFAPAKASEQDEIIALWQACGLTRPWNDPASDYALALANPTSAILTLRGDGELLGSVMVGFDGHRGWVYYLAVNPEQQGQGHGRALMQAAEEWLRERGSPKIQLMVRGDNEVAKGFYAAIGYEEQSVVTIGRRLD